MGYLIAGVVLAGFSWILAWTQFSPFAIYYFPPLWLGYTLTINGMSEILYRDSLIRRMGWWFLLLFLFSIPLWWFFEYLNAYLQNWHYLIPQQWSPTEIAVMKTISFATVIPAVFSTAFLFLHFLKIRNDGVLKAMPTSALLGSASILLGVILLMLMVMYPRILFPLAWIAPLLIVDPVNLRFGFPSVLGELSKGKWLLPAAFAFGTLFTGFFWEMWNFYAFPKWEYTIPYLGFFKIFEMPILGYLGYLPFGLFVFSFTAFAIGMAGKVLHRSPPDRLFPNV